MTDSEVECSLLRQLQMHLVELNALEIEMRSGQIQAGYVGNQSEVSMWNRDNITCNKGDLPSLKQCS